MTKCINIDGVNVPFEEGQTIMQAAENAGVYIPHLCHHAGYAPHGSCKLCSVRVNGRVCTACTFPAAEGQSVINNSRELQADRRRLTQMLFVEGNHNCPSCEKSGDCRLQAVAYYLRMEDDHFPLFYPPRPLDSSHPDILIEHNRCIVCSLCVRASRDIDGKNVFAVSGRGAHKHLIVNSPSGRLGDSDISTDDAAAHICPTGAILIKGQAFHRPIGQRLYDLERIDGSPHAGEASHEA